MNKIFLATIKGIKIALNSIDVSIDRLMGCCSQEHSHFRVKHVNSGTCNFCYDQPGETNDIYIMMSNFYPIKIVVTIVLAFFLCGHSTAVFAAQTAQSVAKSNQINRWNLPSRSIAVGGAYTADASGLQGGLTNPASLSRIQSHQFSAELQTWRNTWNLFSSGIAIPTYGGHSWAFHGSWLDYGELEPQSSSNNLFRPQGNEFKGGVSYSYRMTDRTSIGITGGLLSSKIGFRNREHEPYVDIGYLQKLPYNMWFGMSVENLAGELSLDGGPDKLPLQGRTGLAWSIWQQRMTFTADAVYHNPGINSDQEDKMFGGAGGARMLIFEHFRFSGGYHNYYDNYSGFTGGVEVQYPNFNWKMSFMETGRDNLVRMGGNMRF